MIIKNNYLFFIIATIISHYALGKPRHIFNDFSNLNKTKIHKVVYPKDYDEIKNCIEYAQTHSLKISIAGKRHSQGGHTLYPNALLIDIKNLKKIISCNLENNLVTVQSGVTWKQLQEYLHQYNRAVSVMQVANIFTIGGALSVNANGIDPHYGPLIETVESLKIMTSSGTIITADRQNNYELFKLAIGGYGLFGIILEATLRIVPNDLYKSSFVLISLKNYSSWVKEMSSNSRIGFHYAYIPLKSRRRGLFCDVWCAKHTMLSEAEIKLLTKHQRKEAYALKDPGFIMAKRLTTSLVRDAVWAKQAYVNLMPRKTEVLSRNSIMRLPVDHAYSISNFFTHILQEYFIPVDKIDVFLNSLKQITIDLKINVIHIALRYIRANNEAFLSYAKTDCIGVVIMIGQSRNKYGYKKMERWTNSLIDAAHGVGGSYYLVIPLYPTKDKLKKVYPGIDDFFKYKKKYDPQELFNNHFYQKYLSIV